MRTLADVQLLQLVGAALPVTRQVSGSGGELLDHALGLWERQWMACGALVHLAFGTVSRDRALAASAHPGLKKPSVSFLSCVRAVK